jgi:Polyketide synthase dehydratase
VSIPSRQCSYAVLVDEIVVSSKTALEPFKYSVPAQLWYKAMGDVGYSFGPQFQKKMEVESVAGRRYSRVLLSFSDAESTFPQSDYPMHPVCIDGCLQSGVPSLWQGHRSSIDTVLVPAIIDDVVIRSRLTQPKTGIAVTNSEYVGVGKLDEARSFKTHASVYDTKSGSLLYKMSGLHYNKLDMQKDRHGASAYTRLVWKPDISFLTQARLLSLAPKQRTNISAEAGAASWVEVIQVIALIAHKKPNLTVMEVNGVSSAQSTWLECDDVDSLSRRACRRYLFTSNTSSNLLEAQERYQRHPHVEFSICDITKPAHEFTSHETSLDFVLVKLVSLLGDNSIDKLF